MVFIAKEFNRILKVLKSVKSGAGTTSKLPPLLVNESKVLNKPLLSSVTPFSIMKSCFDSAL